MKSLLFGNFAFGIGYQVFSFAIVLWAKTHFNSGTSVAQFLIVNTVVMLFVEPLAGAWADSGRRHFMLRYCVYLPGIVFFCTFIYCCVFKEWPWFLMALSMLSYGVAFASLRPTIYSMPVQKQAVSDSVHSQSAWLQAGDMSSIIIGQICGALLMVQVGVSGIMVLCLALLGISILTFRHINCPDGEGSIATVSLVGIFKSIVDGGRLIWDERNIRALFSVLIVINLFFPATMVLLPFLVTDSLHQSIAWVGYCMAIQGIGFCVGSVANRYSLINMNRHISFIVAVLTIGVTMCMTAYVRDVYTLMVIMFFVGVCLSITNISVISQLRLSVSAHFHGRILGYLMLFAGALSPLSYAGAGILVDTCMQPSEVYLLIGIVLFACGLLMFSMKSIKSFFAIPRPSF